MKSIEKVIYENNTKVKKDKNHEAYLGLKRIGHNFASRPYNSNLDYISEWNEEKGNPNNFDCDFDLKAIPDDKDELKSLIDSLSD